MSDAFFSYSHLDRAVVGHLHAGLTARGKQVWVDDQQIAPASRWAEELKGAIEGADAFVFVISPDSAVSPECRRELAHAVALNKRIIPCVVRATDLGLLPEELRAHQFVPSRGVFTDDFETSLALLTSAIETDLDWVREHTRWGRRAIDWAEHGHDRGYLVGGSELHAAEAWLAGASGRRPEATPLQNAYVLAARKASDRRQRTWQVALGVGLVVAVVLAGLAFVQRDHARRERNAAVAASRLASARALAAEATADLSTDPQESLQLALSSTRISPTPTADESLRLALAATPQRGVIASGSGTDALAAWSPSDASIAVAGPSGTVALWDPATLRLRSILHDASGTAALSGLAWSPDGRWLAATTSAGAVSVWAAATGAPVATTALDGAVRAAVLPGTAARSTGASLTWLAGSSPELLVWGPGLARVVGFRPVSGAGGTALVAADGLADLTTSTDGSRVLALDAHGYDAFALPSDHRTVLHLPADGGEAPDNASCWTPDDRTAVTWDDLGAGDLEAHFWNTATGAQTSAVAVDDTITAAACATSGRDDWVAIGDAAGAVRLVEGDGTTTALTGQNGTIDDIASSPDGAELATASADGTVRVWDATDGSLIRVLAAHGVPVEHVAFSPDGTLVVSVDQQGTVRIWDAGAGHPVAGLDLPGSAASYPLGYVDGGREIYGLAVGRAPASGGRTHAPLGALTAVVWQADSGRVLRTTTLSGATAPPVACPDDLQILDFCDLPPPPDLLVDLPPATAADATRPVTVALSADGRDTAYGRSGGVTVTGSSGDVVGHLDLPAPPTGLAYVGGDRLLVMTATAVDLWTPGSASRDYPQPSGPIDAAVSADGTRLAVADVGGTVTVSQVATGARVATLIPSDAGRGASLSKKIAAVPTRVAISADGDTVTAGTTFQAVLTWSLPAGRITATRIVTPTGGNTSDYFGGGGPWPIATLRLSADGSHLLVADFPQIGAGDSKPPATAMVLDARTLRPEATYSSPGTGVAATNPGAALGPDGDFLLAGASGLAPAPPGGVDAVYEVGSGQLVAGLRSVPTSTGDTAAPADPWSPSGVDVVAGNAVYACDGCGSLAQLEARAEIRLGWTRPLSATHPVSPTGDPYG